MAGVLLRVREVLASADCRAALRGKLPKEATVPPEVRGSYPQNLLKLLGGEEKYSNLGVVTELLLRREVIDHAAVAEIAAQVLSATVPETLNLATYLARAKGTKAKMVALAGDQLLYDTVVRGKSVEGHPDARTATDVFEEKASGRVQSCWVDFLLQLFAYAALDPAVQRVHLVLSLQDFVWSWDAAHSWPKREQFRQALEDHAARRLARETRPEAGKDAMALGLTFAMMPIGSHVGKGKDVVSTLAQVVGHRLPWQIFLSPPRRPTSGSATQSSPRPSSSSLTTRWSYLCTDRTS